MQLTNKLHRLAQRLQIDYHTLIQYLSQDSESIAEKAKSIEVIFKIWNLFIGITRFWRDSCRSDN